MSPSRQRLAGILLAFVLGIAQSVLAQPDLERKASERGFLSDPEDKWSESDQIKYPEAPREPNLARLDPELIRDRYKYFIDRASVTMGSDRVLRYTVVIEPPDGARNVFYEGIRCATSEFKTYAYATNTGKFRPLAAQKWRKLKTTAPYDYRRLLAERYVCNSEGWALDEEQVQKRLAQGDPASARLRPRPAGH
jgi:hypothetical protein